MVLGKQYKIKVTKRFKQDLNAVLYNIAFICMNIDAANKLLDAVEKAIKELSFSAHSYEPYTHPKCKYVYMRIYVRNYVIYYTLSKNVMVLRKFLLGKVNTHLHLS